MKKAIRSAVDLYRSFREQMPKKIDTVHFDLPQAVAVIGHVDEILYTTTHNGKTQAYRHPFQPGSRPLMAVSGDGTQILLLGGRYKFTARGIVDRDAKGKLVYEPAHGDDDSGFLRRRQAE
jgi:hypothetical protein